VHLVGDDDGRVKFRDQAESLPGAYNINKDSVHCLCNDCQSISDASFAISNPGKRGGKIDILLIARSRNYPVHNYLYRAGRRMRFHQK